MTDPIIALDLFSRLHEKGCYAESLMLGAWIGETFREKNYSISSEVFSVFLPEDALSEYVLESYERAYLASMMATSYLALGMRDEAAIELRRSYSEGKAFIYNYGDDPINELLLANLWEILEEPDSARPFWSKLRSDLSQREPLYAVADKRIAVIDRGARSSTAPPKIFAIGRFPELDWHIELARKESGYYRLSSKKPFPDSCVSTTGLVMPTEPWLRKIEARYKADYHPLLNAKSWVRLPIGVAYGVTTFGLGVGLLVGGCGADGAMKGNGELCRAAAQGGVALMSNAGTVTNFALKPDMRHWERVPAALFITHAEDETTDTCYDALRKHGLIFPIRTEPASRR